MRIILDTNIFVSDWQLTSYQNRILLDYVNAGSARIAMPQIVWEEIEGKYRSGIEAALSSHKKAVKGINKYILNEAIRLPKDVEFHVDDLVKDYQDFLKDKLGLDEYSFIPLPKDIIATLVHKAVYRKKPFDANGQQFRDAILWHSIGEATKNSPYGRDFYALISKDSSAFGDSNGELHPQLIEEAKSMLPSTVAYYNSMQKFITVNYTPVKHITINWVKEHVSQDEAVEYMKAIILERPLDVIQASNSEKFGHFYLEDTIQIDFEPFEILSHLVYTFSSGKAAVLVDVEGVFRHEGQTYTTEVYHDDDYSVASYEMKTNSGSKVIYLHYRVTLYYRLQDDGSIILEGTFPMEFHHYE